MFSFGTPILHHILTRSQRGLPIFAQELSKEGRQFDAKRVIIPVQSPMHEVSIMEEAVRLAVDAAKSAGANRVLALRLRVGTLSGVVPEAMRFAFDVVCNDTIAAGASLEIESVQAECWCETCRAEFECADFFNECPRCHNLIGELRRGRELEIASVEIE
jgi:hydrogenase nickel incorporation protein HypA/HybF